MRGIDPDVYAEVWEKLCQRFGRRMDKTEAGDYRTYLEGQGVTTDAFVAAAGALWATREFFPRPADFLLVEREKEWDAVMDAIDAHRPPHKSGWEHLTPGSRAQRAVSSLGGLGGLKELHQRNPIQARQEFFAAYELQVIESSEELYLQIKRPDQKVLPIGSVERRAVP